MYPRLRIAVDKIRYIMAILRTVIFECFHLIDLSLLRESVA